MQAQTVICSAILPIALTSLLGILGAASGAAQTFDGTRAFRDLRELVDLGPRVPGTKPAESARSLIRERLRQAGWTTQSQDVERQGDRVVMVLLDFSGRIWDPAYGTDGIGPRGEFGTPYRFEPFSWQETFRDPRVPVSQR